LKNVFKVSRVSYFVQCKDTIDLLIRDGVEVKQVQHAHTTFYLVVPEGQKKADFE